MRRRLGQATVTSWLVAIGLISALGCEGLDTNPGVATDAGTAANDSGFNTESCPSAHVCGSGNAVACNGPLEFAADAGDLACTPVAYCPENAVCGTGEIIACNSTTEFARDPIDTSCTPNTECPVATCTIDGTQICDRSCVAQSFGITEDNAPTRTRPWVRDTDDALVSLGREDAWNIGSLIDAPALTPAHAAHVSVPGSLGDTAEFTQESVTINATNPGRSRAYWYSGADEPVWRSTGLFAAPGRVFTVELPDNVVNPDGTGLQIQVGSHTDRELVWRFPFDQPIRRFPEIVHTRTLDGKITAMTSAFGGLIYIRVAAGTTLGATELRITNAVRAPTYTHGVTDPITWRSEIESSPVPLTELIGEKLIITVRTQDVADIDPDALMAWWEQAMNAIWYLAGITEDNARVERIVADPAIEGIAHSGYPISMAELWTPGFVDLSSQQENQWWTTLHELGHNFQHSGWTFIGLQEATCNLWPLYVLETLSSVPRRYTHPDEEMGDAKRTARIQAYVDDGRDFRNNWQMGFNAYQGFIPLEVFMQLQEAFGWELFHELNQIYRALPDTEVFLDSDVKIQNWIVRSSQSAGVNLQNFYEDWGFPITDDTRAAITGLPNWDANPMDRFD